MNNLKDGEADLSDLKYSNSDAANGLLLRPGDVLFNRTNSIEHVGRTGIWRGQLKAASFASYLVRLDPLEGKLDPQFLNRWLNWNRTQLRIRQYATPGVHQVNINPTNLRRTEITLPDDVSEQRQIAEVLDTVDEAIRRTGQIIAKLKQVKQGLLHDLLTRGIDDNGELRDPDRHPEQFKDSPLGRIPKQWEVELLPSVTGYQNGAPFPSAEYGNEGVPLLRPGNIREADFVAWTDRHTTRLPRRWERDAAAYLVGEGEVVMNLTAQSLDDGFLGRVCITGRGTRCLLNQRIARFTPHRVDGAFLLWALKSLPVRAQIDRLPQGTKVQHLYNRNLDRLLLQVPRSEAERRAISSVLFSHGERMAKEHDSRAKLQLLKNGLMEDLLTGRVRVTRLLEDAAA